MGAVFSGAARAPITGIVLIIEMTGEYNLLTPLMLAVVLSTVTGRFLTCSTIYTEELRRRGMSIEDPQAPTSFGARGGLVGTPPADHRCGRASGGSPTVPLPVCRRPVSGPPSVGALPGWRPARPSARH